MYARALFDAKWDLNITIGNKIEFLPIEDAIVLKAPKCLKWKAMSIEYTNWSNKWEM